MSFVALGGALRGAVEEQLEALGRPRNVMLAFPVSFALAAVAVPDALPYRTH